MEGLVAGLTDSYLYSLRPYMIYYGNSISYTAQFPDGRQQKAAERAQPQLLLANVLHAQRVDLPAGTKITVEGVFGRIAASGPRLPRDHFIGTMLIHTATTAASVRGPKSSAGSPSLGTTSSSRLLRGESRPVASSASPYSI